MILFEKSFGDILDEFTIYFYIILVAMSWNCLVYEPDSYCVLVLIDEFYDKFFQTDINRYKTSIRDVNIHARTISWIAGTVLDNRNRNTNAIKEHITMMGSNHTIKRNCSIIGMMIYINIYATCCWIHYNVIGITHI